MSSTWKDKEEFLKKNNNKCELCRELDSDDTLYTSYSHDLAIEFRCINHIKYCPLCGKELFIWEA